MVVATPEILIEALAEEGLHGLEAAIFHGAVEEALILFLDLLIQGLSTGQAIDILDQEDAMISENRTEW